MLIGVFLWFVSVCIALTLQPFQMLLRGVVLCYLGSFYTIWLAQPELKIAVSPTRIQKGDGLLAACEATQRLLGFASSLCLLGTIENAKSTCKARTRRLDSSTCLHAVGDKAVEFFFASDAR